MKRMIVALLASDGQMIEIGKPAYQDFKVESIQYRQNGLDKVNVRTPGYLIEMSNDGDSVNAFVPEREVERTVFIETKKEKTPEVSSAE